LFSQGQGDALEQIPADVIDKVEVMTNPPAEFKAEGTGGIINLVTKRNRKIPASGRIRLNVGSEGNINASLHGNINLGGVRLNASYSERRNIRHSAQNILRSDGTTELSSQDISSKTDTSSRFAMLKAGYDIDRNNTVDLGGVYMARTGKTVSGERAVSDSAATDTTRQGLTHPDNENVQTTLDFRHDFATKGERFDLHLSHAESWSLQNQNYSNIVTATGAPEYWQLRLQDGSNKNSELTAHYALPLSHDGMFSAGYEVEDINNRSNNNGYRRSSLTDDWSVDSMYTSLFVYDRTTHSGFATYQQKYGSLGIKGGLRLEQDYVTTDLKTTGEVNDTSTLGVFPSLYLTYNLTDTHQIGLSYSRRTHRPEMGELNPAQQSSDAYNIRAGNPLLKPEMINAYEASYHYLGAKDDVTLTGYYRSTDNAISSVYRNISDTVLLTTYGNLARRMASGMSAHMNITVLQGLSLRANGYVAYTEFDPNNGSAADKRSGINWSLGGGINWRITPDDQLQFRNMYRAAQVSAQSRSKAVLSGNFGYRHSFTKQLSANVMVNNLYASENASSIQQTAGVYQSSRSRMQGRSIFCGLTYAFGGERERETPDENDRGDEENRED
ncbi:MAG: outer membrane beta-barrel family protein, partial [Rhizomicrobium sp.]